MTCSGSSGSMAQVLRNVAQAADALLSAQVRLTKDMFKLLPKREIENMFRQPGQRGAGCHSCSIPDPCWLPKRLGEVTSLVSDCKGEARLRLRMSNENAHAEDYTVAVSSTTGSGVVPRVEPSSLQIAPFSEGTVELVLELNDKGSSSATYTVLVKGCRSFVVRWTIRRTQLLESSTVELTIVDVADYEHHWYDHFYCHRPCNHGRDQFGKRVTP